MMKKEFVVFLILIAVGAIVCGATVVMINEIPILVEQWNENERNKKLEPPPEEKDELTKSFIPSLEPAAPIVISNYLTSNESQILTREEEASIRVMMRSLGFVGDNFTEVMKAYQASKSMEVTGVLTTETLESIVRDLTISKLSSL